MSTLGFIEIQAPLITPCANLRDSVGEWIGDKDLV